MTAIKSFKKENWNNNHFRTLPSYNEFGEYKCTGKCFCKERRKSIAVSRGLFFVISSLSTIVAIEIFKKRMESECHQLLMTSCEQNSVQTRIDECVEIIGPQPKKKKFKAYYCKGHCMKRKFNNDITKIAAEEFGCENFKIDSKVFVDTERLSSKFDPNWKAREIFAKDYLSPFCKSISKFEYVYKYKKRTGTIAKARKVVKLCVGQGGQVRKPNFWNVKCHIIH